MVKGGNSDLRYALPRVKEQPGCYERSTEQVVNREAAKEAFWISVPDRLLPAGIHTGTALRELLHNAPSSHLDLDQQSCSSGARSL